MKPWQLFKLTLAVLSLTDILKYQVIALPLRERLGWRHDATGTADQWEPTKSKTLNFFGQVLSCFRCTSVWVSGILFVLRLLPGYNLIESVLIASWVATYLNRKVN